jgi:RNA polymerase sigma-70 factor, ECF subfamily
MGVTERDIVAGILRSDERFLRIFYTRFHAPLASYIRKKVALEADSEEILQDTLLGALEGLRDYSFRSSLFTFLCGIANHKVIDFYRKKRVKSIIFSRMGEWESLVSTVLLPEDAFDERMVRENIRRTFERVTPRYRLILRLKYIEGYSVSEIAHKLSLTFKSAESLLFRARQAFSSAFVQYL